MKQPDPEHQIHSDGYKANTEAMHIDCDTTVRHYVQTGLPQGNSMAGY